MVIECGWRDTEETDISCARENEKEEFYQAHRFSLISRQSYIDFEDVDR